MNTEYGMQILKEKEEEQMRSLFRSINELRYGAKSNY